MSIEKLTFAEPFFTVLFVDKEEKFSVEPMSLVINLAHKANQPLYVRDMPVAPLKATVVAGVELTHVVNRQILFPRKALFQSNKIKMLLKQPALFSGRLF